VKVPLWEKSVNPDAREKSIDQRMPSKPFTGFNLPVKKANTKPEGDFRHKMA
jgi:hypothetical protein